MFQLIKDLPENEFLIFNSKGIHSKALSINQERNRETLLRLYRYLIKNRGSDEKKNHSQLRSVFSSVLHHKKTTLPKIIERDGFLAHFALGKAIRIRDAKKIVHEYEITTNDRLADEIICDFTQESAEFFDVNATPPGFLPKLFPYFRLRADAKLLERVRIDLQNAAQIMPDKKRRLVTYMLLSFSLAYRECDHLTIEIPHFTEKDKLVRYRCQQHLIAEGIKSISMIPEGKENPPIYLCQGTEIWPSQPSMLGSILNNFAEHGSATQAYAHSWRRIHKQLRDLTYDQKPIVMGHSMGGALAIQIALYSHDLIQESYAFNPPMPGQRDEQFFYDLPLEVKKKLKITANLDDVAFWRIGERVFGNITCYLSVQRWRYYPFKIKDVIFLLPIIYKLIWNIKKAFPSHQKIFPLTPGYLSFELSPEEIAIENRSRIDRFDYLHFLPKLYDPLKWLVYMVRKIFKWSLEEEYLKNEIEIIALHERDLLDTITVENATQVKKKIEKLNDQKKELQLKLKIQEKS